MFERFTERARQVVVLAQQAARDHHHNHIGTEHILEGLILEEEGLAVHTLSTLYKSKTGKEDLLEHVQSAITKIVGVPESETATPQIPFTPRGRKVLEMSLREALSLGYNYIGTEHILLGLVRENEGVGMRILLDLEIDADAVRNEVIRMLSGPGGKSPEGVQTARQRGRTTRSTEERLVKAMCEGVRITVALKDESKHPNRVSGYISALMPISGQLLISMYEVNNNHTVSFLRDAAESIDFHW